MESPSEQFAECFLPTVGQRAVHGRAVGHRGQDDPMPQSGFVGLQLLLREPFHDFRREEPDHHSQGFTLR